MESIIERIKRGKFWKFHGGIHPPSQKFLTTDKPIKKMAIPPLLRVPVRQHIGDAGDIIVEVGQKVLKGQPLTKNSTPMAVPVHAPTSGTISSIELCVIAHPSGMSEPCILIETDGLDQWCERQICTDYRELNKSDIVSKIHQAGISGMGGAGFPSHIKVGTIAPIDFLIINAAECEPYITADDLLMREQTAMIIDGIEILDHIISPKHILIGIEDNKPEAIDALQKLSAHNEKIQVCVLPTIYPTGGEKQLIQVLTGKEVLSGVLPSALGIVMQNVGTCYAIADAVLNDKPLIERVVTVSGQGLEKPQNVWALLGTPIEFLIEQCNYKQHNKKHIIMGGPMMGFSLPSPKVPVVKTTNCILAPSEEEIPNDSQEIECIRCGQCADVCPSLLLPQELQWSAKAKDHDQLNKLNLFDCIECGACAYVCPSHIPLVHYYRVAKAEIRQQQLADVKAEKAKQRFEARKARLEREKKAREEKQRRASEARRARMNSGSSEGTKEKSAVAAALARVKAKKNQGISDEAPETTAKSKAAAAIARAKAKKQAQQSEQVEQNNSNDVKDDKKAQVSDAIARAKAKKAQKSDAVEQTPQSIEVSASDASSATTNQETKSKRVSAAVAKAKAKKLAKNNDAAAIDDVEQTPPPKKSDRVSAAVAKAKAKKKQASEALSNTESSGAESKENEALNNTTEEITEESTTVKKTKADRIAAAVAKAKTKKQASKPAESQDSLQKAESVTEVQENSAVVEEPLTESTNKNTDDRSAKIAAAIAKAKAKKQNTVTTNTSKASSQEALEEKSATKPSPVASVARTKQEKIAAAIAKAKAKKQQLESE
ncbi:electron transport complex subunit RsxC [Thalassotalea fusca]